jgi:hypothetical protein
MFRIIEPEVPGGIGIETELDNSTHPPLITKLHIEFEGWLGNDILEIFPCFLISEELKIKISNAALTGINFDQVIVSKSQRFDEVYPNKQLPTFYWAKINGQLEKNDFAIDDENCLVISELAFRILSEFNIANALIEEINN